MEVEGRAVDVEAVLHRLDHLVEQQLARSATEVDRSGSFPVDNIAGLAQLGLLGLVVDTAHGGLGADGPSVRAALRSISSGCGATGFAFAQHHGTVASVAATDNAELRSHWLPKLLTDALAGTAFAHVRRPGRPVLSAEPHGDGWVLDGAAPWVTSWGHAAVMSVAATTDDGRLVWSLLPMVEGDGVRVSKRFDLVALAATATVALTFDRVRIGPEQILRVDDAAAWARRDRLMAARPSPLCLGIGDRALAELDVIDSALAERYRPSSSALAEQAEAAASAVDAAGAVTLPDDEHEALVEETARRRTDVILGVQRIATALLSAAGGAAMDRAHPAQRLSREAMFFVVQAQSPDGRRATLRRLAR